MKHKNSFAVLPYGYFNLIVRETLGGGGGEGGEKKEKGRDSFAGLDFIYAIIMIDMYMELSSHAKFQT